MNRLILKVGDSLYIGAEQFKVRSIGRESVALKSTANGRPRRLTHDELVSMHTRQRLTLPAIREASLEKARSRMLDRHLADLSPLARAEAKRRAAYVREYRSLPFGSRGREVGAMITRVAARIGDPSPPHSSSIMRWNSLSSQGQGDGQNVMALAPLFGRRGNHSDRFAPSIRKLLVALVEENLLRPRPVTIAEAYRTLADTIERLNQTENATHVCPSEKAIRAQLDTCDGFRITVAREGRPAAKRKYRTYGKGPETTRICERWEIDHCLAAIYLYDEETGLLLGRPWITTIIDHYSRVIVGFHIGFDPPSYLAVMHALLHALRPKDYVRTLYPNIASVYPYAWPPELLATDRGSDLTSEALENALYDLVPVHLVCPVRQPWYKARIERFFQTLKRRLLLRIEGSIRDDLPMFNEQRAYRRAALGYAEFVCIFHHWLLDDYHRMPHAGLGTSLCLGVE